MADYHAYLANALFVGEEFVAHENGRTRALIRLHLDCLPVEIMQERAVVTGTFGDFKAQAVHTTHLFVRDAPADALSALEELSRNVAELLSFATVSDVVAFGYDFPAVNPPGERRAFSGVAQYFKPVIETHDGTAVREFLEKTYPAYKASRDAQKLNVALRYYVLCDHPDLPVEAALVLSFVLLEHLKHSFAVSSGFPRTDNVFHDPLLAGQKNDQFHFRTLLKRMFSSVSMQPALQPAIALRNELIHSGLTSLDADARWAMYEQIHDWLREYLLRVLGYSGCYFPYSERAPKKI